jgi:lysophospholipase L1-like esterase
MKFMKVKLVSIAILLLVLAGCGGGSSSGGSSSGNKIACVGDSITYGTNIGDRANNSYPAQLQKRFGSSKQVANFGVPGATLLKSGDRPYVNTADYGASQAFQPDIVVIMLGSNDLKPQNWSNKSSYVAHYAELIASYRALSSDPVVYICLPPPLIGSFAGITNTKLVNELLPRIRQVASENGVGLIDNYTPLVGKNDHYADNIHPNAQGAAVIAETVYNVID